MQPTRYTVTVYYMTKRDAKRLGDYARMHPEEVAESEERGKHAKINRLVKLNNRYTRKREYHFRVTPPVNPGYNLEYTRAGVDQYMKDQAIGRAMDKLECVKNAIEILDVVAFEDADDNS